LTTDLPNQHIQFNGAEQKTFFFLQKNKSFPNKCFYVAKKLQKTEHNKETAKQTFFFTKFFLAQLLPRGFRIKLITRAAAGDTSNEWTV